MYCTSCREQYERCAQIFSQPIPPKPPKYTVTSKLSKKSSSKATVPLHQQGVVLDDTLMDIFQVKKPPNTSTSFHTCIFPPMRSNGHPLSISNPKISTSPPNLYPPLQVRQRYTRKSTDYTSVHLPPYSTNFEVPQPSTNPNNNTFEKSSGSN